MRDQIKELALTNCLTDAEIILGDARSLADELRRQVQAAKDERKAQEKEFKEFMSELWSTLRKIQAQHRIEAQLLNLIKPYSGNQKSEFRQNSEGES